MATLLTIIYIYNNGTSFVTHTFFNVIQSNTQTSWFSRVSTWQQSNTESEEENEKRW